MSIRGALKVAFTIAATACLAVWMIGQSGPPADGSARFVPPGALLYLETRNLAKLIQDWDQSDERTQWLRSANYEAFSRSRLALRLEEARAELSSVAGLPADLDLVRSIAGSQSALAVYDIGNLEFVYITQLPSARVLQTQLWNRRNVYQTRTVAGQNYYVRSGEGTRRLTAFAAAGDRLFVSTREDLMASALTLLGGGTQQPSISSEAWFQAAASARPQAKGELRMLINMSPLARTPYFRSYWIQGNAREMSQYSAGVIDVVRDGGQVREDRVLLRQESTTSSTDGTAAGRLLAYVPDDTGLYRIWSQPSPAFAADLILRKIVAPGERTLVRPRFAPPHADFDAVTGTEADLEIHTDQPPLAEAGGPQADPRWVELLNQLPPAGLLHIQSARQLSGSAFVTTESAIAVLASRDWEPGRIASLASAGTWITRGPVLVLSKNKELLDRVAAMLSNPPKPGAAYLAGYRHAQELGPFTRMMRMIDVSLVNQASGAEGQEPPFFSGNIASLGSVLSRLQSLSVEVHDDGARVSQSIVYRTSP